MGAIGGAASVAASQNFMSGEQGLTEQVRRHSHRILQVKNGANGRDGVIQRGADGHMAGTFFGELVDFKLENSAEHLTVASMRYWAFLLGCLFLAACETTDDTYVPGRIPKATAVAIAMQANKQYPYPLSKVTRVSWRPDQGYWAIDFKDEDEDFGKFYLVNGRGKIVGVGTIQGDNYY
jgi:hypothetical protein